MADPYEHKAFPKMVYFESGATRVVKNEDELSQAKSEGAAESPADHGFVETETAQDKAQRQARERAAAEQAAQAQREQQEREAAESESRRPKK